MAGSSRVRRSLLARLWSLRGQPFTRAQRMALGLMTLGILFAVALPLLLVMRQWQVERFLQVDATVTALDLPPPVQSEGWEVSRAGRVTLTYVASGLPQTVTLEANRFDPERLVLGNTVPLHVDPNHLGQVETETTWHTFLVTVMLTVAAVGVAVLAWLLFRWLTPEVQPDEDDDGEAEDDDDIFEPMPERPRFRR